MLWRRFPLILCCCAASAVAFAQQPLNLPPVSPAAPPAASGSISLSVVVTDKSGHPIRGLTQADFTLLDDKQPAAIRSFTAHDLSTAQNDPQTMILLIDDVNANFSVVSTVRMQIENFLHSNGGKLPIPVGIELLTDNGSGDDCAARNRGQCAGQRSAPEGWPAARDLARDRFLRG